VFDKAFELRKLPCQNMAGLNLEEEAVVERSEKDRLVPEIVARSRQSYRA
jgi:hypothetical protein